MSERTDTERLEFYVRFVAESGVNDCIVSGFEDTEGNPRPEFWFWQYDHSDSTFETFRDAIDFYMDLEADRQIAIIEMALERIPPDQKGAK